MPQTATIKSLPVAFAMLKAMQAEGLEWDEDYRGAAQQALTELLAGRMDQLIDEHPERMAELGEADRRNGCHRRWLLTEIGEIELAVLRSRSFSALKVVRTYARRAKHVDRMILACFLLGLSTRKVAAALLPVLGRPVSPATVSAWPDSWMPRSPRSIIYRVLVLDNVVLKRKTGAGALARPMLVALGLRPTARPRWTDATPRWQAGGGRLSLPGRRDVEVLPHQRRKRSDATSLLDNRLPELSDQEPSHAGQRAPHHALGA
jgi:hypothetical protein